MDDKRYYVRYGEGQKPCDEVEWHDEEECEEQEHEDECWEIKAKICFPDDPKAAPTVKEQLLRHEENCIKIEAEIKHGDCREHKEHKEEEECGECWEHGKKREKDECWKIKAKICFPEMRVLLSGIGGVIRKDADAKREDMHDENCIKIEAEVKHKKKCHEHEEHEGDR